MPDERTESEREADTQAALRRAELASKELEMMRTIASIFAERCVCGSRLSVCEKCNDDRCYCCDPGEECNDTTEEAE